MGIHLKQVQRWPWRRYIGEATYDGPSQRNPPQNWERSVPAANWRISTELVRAGWHTTDISDALADAKRRAE